MDAGGSEPWCSAADVFAAAPDGSDKSRLLGLNVEFDGDVTSLELSDFFSSLSQFEMEFREGDMVGGGDDAMAGGGRWRTQKQGGETRGGCRNVSLGALAGGRCRCCCCCCCCCWCWRC